MLSRCCRIINKTTLKNLLNKQLKLASIGNIRKFNSTLPRSDTKSTLSSTDSLTINAPEIESSGTPLNEDNLSLIDGSQEIVNAIGSNIPEMGWGPKYQIMNLIENLHIFADMPYWESLIIISIGVRFLLLPIAIKTAQNTARLAALRPDLQRLQDAFNNNPNSADLRVKTQYQMDMKALFLKHKVNPIMSFLMPLFQLPIFIAFFTALRDIGTYYPGVATGGAYWFTDLTAPDLFLILPILNGITFLLMVEVGADGLATGQKNSFKMAMRLVSIAIVPLTMSMPQGLFLYWNTNNIFSLIQAFILKSERVKKILEIPDLPKEEETPPLNIVNPFDNIMTAIKKEFLSSSKPEVIDLSASEVPVPPPPPPTSKPPPITYSSPPKMRVKKKQ